MATRSSKKSSSTVGLVIREYRQLRGFTQKQFASELGVEARTLRMYENGERPLENISDLRRIAELLAIDPIELGLAASTLDTYTAQDVNETTRQIAGLILEARLVEARTVSETLLSHIKKQSGSNEQPFLSALTLAYCVNGHIQALTRRTRDIYLAIQQYQEQAKIARVLEDQTLLNFALSYQGDMLRRKGDVAQAIACLEQVRAATPQATESARGNNALCLAQVHLTSKDYRAYLIEMASAEELAQNPGIEAHPALTQFSLGVVYAEYGRGYGFMGNIERSQHYLEQAEMLLPVSNLWALILKMTRAETLVHVGDVSNAMPPLVEVAHLAHMYGHQRMIERLYRLQYILDDQATLFRQASRSLSEVLHGPVEFS